MDLIDTPPKFDIGDRKWSIYSRNQALEPQYIGVNAKLANSCVTEGCIIDGTVSHSVIFEDVTIGRGAVIEDSVIMQGARIGENACIKRAIIGSGVIVGEGCRIGLNEAEENPYASPMCTHGIVLVAGGAALPAGSIIARGSMVEG